MSAKPLLPWPLPLVSLTAALPILLLSAAVSRVHGLPLVRELTLVAGAALIGHAVVTRMRETGWHWPERVQTAALLSSCSAAAAGMAAYGITEEWGEARLFFGAASLLGFGCTGLVLLPDAARKVALSLWVLFHFGGTFTAFSSIDPPGGQGPYVSKHLWTFVYRPYLSFLYLTNAYHFYSPDPGAPNLLWFAVHYSDGQYTWVRVPNREKPQIGMHYQRLLALPEHSFSPNPRWPVTRAEVNKLLAEGGNEDQVVGRIWDDVYDRRLRGSLAVYPVTDPKTGAVRGRYPIPMPSDVDVSMMYREPNETSRKLIAAVARKVMLDAPPRKGVQVRSVKVYRVTHQILTPQEVAAGVSPYLRTKYWPYFLGEYDADGKLVNPDDPFLYWYVPILLVPADYPRGQIKDGVPMIAARQHAAEPNFELDGLEMHAAGKEKQ